MRKEILNIFWAKMGSGINFYAFTPEDMKMSEDLIYQLAYKFTDIVEDANKKLITKRKFNNMMKKKMSQGVGEPICYVEKEAIEYFDRKYLSSEEFIKSLVNNFEIEGKKIVSIGAGFGAEEILFSLIGDNKVYCIEPDEMSSKVIKKKAKKLKANIEVFLDSVQTFDVDEKFDVIYTSSPSDWMTESKTIPLKYIDFIKRYRAENGIVILRLYAGNFNKELLTNPNFLNSMNKFFPGMSYYISLDRNQAIVVSGIEGKSIAGFQKCEIQ